MKLIKLILLIILIVAAIYAGHFIKQQGTGFVLIQYQDFSIESSMFVFAAFIILLFIVVYALLRFTLNLLKMPSFLSQRYEAYQNKKSSSGLISGLIEFTEGQFKKAESIFIKQAANNENSFLNYLLAARAAQLLHADNRRDNYLKQAHEINPNADIAIGLTQAELQLSHHQNEMALATLNQLNTAHPKHNYVLRLMARAYLQLEDWTHLCPLLSELRQAKILPEEVLIKMERTAYLGYLSAAGQKDAEKLETIWSAVPKSLRTDNQLIVHYCQQLINNSQYNKAESILRERLNKQWDESLIKQYADIIDLVTNENNEKFFNNTLTQCEKWLTNLPYHATVLLAAGKVCVTLKLWGKAKNYFESSLTSQAMPETYLQMALLLERNGENDNADKYYQLGLKFSVADRSSAN